MSSPADQPTSEPSEVAGDDTFVAITPQEEEALRQGAPGPAGYPAEPAPPLG